MRQVDTAALGHVTHDRGRPAEPDLDPRAVVGVPVVQGVQAVLDVVLGTGEPEHDQGRPAVLRTQQRARLVGPARPVRQHRGHPRLRGNPPGELPAQAGDDRPVDTRGRRQHDGDVGGRVRELLVEQPLGPRRRIARCVETTGGKLVVDSGIPRQQHDHQQAGSGEYPSPVHDGRVSHHCEQRTGWCAGGARRRGASVGPALVPSVRPLVPSVRQRGIRHPIGAGFALLRRISERRHDAPSRISRADGSRDGRTVAASGHASGHGAPHGALRGSPELLP